jgi:hypothetical protein
LRQEGDRLCDNLCASKNVPLVKRNRRIVDAGAPLSHQPFFVELPQFASVGAIPLAIGVLPFVLEADADAIFAKASQRFLQFVVELLGPLVLQEGSYFRAAAQEFGPVAAFRIHAIGMRKPLGITRIPGILRHLNLLEWRSRVKGGTIV